MGLLNATRVQQWMDTLCGPFKSATYAHGKKVVEQRIRGRARQQGVQLQNATQNLDSVILQQVSPMIQLVIAI